MLTLLTYDSAPGPVIGYVRDIRLRWACAEAGLPLRVETRPLYPKAADHAALQPFEQMPVLRDGAVTVGESGAALWYLAAHHGVLWPEETAAQARVMQWLFAALNTVELVTFPWAAAHFPNGPTEPPAATTPLAEALRPRMARRLAQLEPVLAGLNGGLNGGDDWLAGAFSVADIALADVLRFADRFGGLADCPEARAYSARARARPAFATALAAQRAELRRLP